MLRALVLILFAANVVFYCWTQGWLNEVVGVHPGGQHEPERMAGQVHPDVIRVLPPESASAAADAASSLASVADAGAAPASAADPASGASAAAAASVAAALPAASAAASATDTAMACLEVGPYSLTERVQVEAKLKTVLKAGDWQDRTSERQGAWMVYMGRYGSEDLLHKKEEELRRIKIDYTIVRTPADLAWGLSLGQYEQRAEADAALARVALRGVRTARLVTTRQPDIGHTLRLPRVNATQRATLAQLPAAVWLGRSLTACSAAGP